MYSAHEIPQIVNMVPHLSLQEQQVVRVLVCSAGFFLVVPLCHQLSAEAIKSKQESR